MKVFRGLKEESYLHGHAGIVGQVKLTTVEEMVGIKLVIIHNVYIIHNIFTKVHIHVGPVQCLCASYSFCL